MFLYIAVPQTTHFETAKTEAKVLFLDYKLLECDCNGLEYTSVDHDITLRILGGAVAEGEKVHLEVAVTMYGPFTFPQNTKLVSPILWLCLLEEDITLRKPLQIVLPHYLAENDEHNIRFMKANHRGCKLNDSSQIFYNFQPLVSYTYVEQICRENQGYSMIMTDHFCYLCLGAEITSLSKDINY